MPFVKQFHLLENIIKTSLTSFKVSCFLCPIPLLLFGAHRTRGFTVWGLGTSCFSLSFGTLGHPEMWAGQTLVNMPGVFLCTWHCHRTSSPFKDLLHLPALEYMYTHTCTYICTHGYICMCIHTGMLMCMLPDLCTTSLSPGCPTGKVTRHHLKQQFCPVPSCVGQTDLISAACGMLINQACLPQCKGYQEQFC